MKERIEEKIDKYITSILEKETMDKEDYFALVSELSRIKAIEDAKKWEETKEERVKTLINTVLQ